MKCPLCGQKMRKDSDGLYRCAQCSVCGDRQQLHLIKWNIDFIDEMLATIKTEYKKWESFRIFSLQNPKIAREVLIERLRSKQPKAKPRPNPSSSFKQKLLFLIGSVEIGAFLDWFVANSNNLGTLQPSAVVIPLFMFFQGLLFLFSSWK